MGTMSFIEKLFRLVAPPNAMKLNGERRRRLPARCRHCHRKSGDGSRLPRRHPCSQPRAHNTRSEKRIRRQKKHRVVCGAVPIRHQLHAGRGPGLFRTRSTAMTSRCDRHSRLSVMGLCAAANLAASTGTSV